MSGPETALTKYVFLDIEGFTKGRSVEAQSDLVNALNEVVKSVLESKHIELNDTILLPTGDGICIALLNVQSFDIHLEIGLEIIAKVSEYADQTTDEMRQFKVRIGVNENIDNIVTDVNGRRNVAGNGVNMAQRIMNLADGNQILIGQPVYEILSGRERYMSCLKRYDGSAKHELHFPVYQFVGEGHKGLNIEPPTFVRPKKMEATKLSMLVAYYIGHASKNKNYLLSRRDDTIFNFVAPIILYFKAVDSVDASEASQYETINPATYGAPEAPIDKQYTYYSKNDFWVLAKLSGFIGDKVLRPYSSCFEWARFSYLWGFVNKDGFQKLKDDWPEIWEEFSFDENDQGV